MIVTGSDPDANFVATWVELRTVALVGTERRRLPGGAELSAEQQALRQAALLGVARRAGSPVRRTQPVEPAQSEIPAEKTAPPAAVQLLELMLTGNAGPGRMGDNLLEQWFIRCNELGHVLPHRLLVATLDHATTTAHVRDRVAPTLGHRGRWLAAQREQWAWAVALAGGTRKSTALTTDLDDLLEMPSNQRNANLIAIRATDPTLGRELIAEACARLDATSRARVFGCLQPDLGADDEELIEAALDDRSKLVRATAIAMLDTMPTSARAGRLARWLEPLVAKSGRLRTTITVRFPDPPTDEQQRDLLPDGNEVIEQQWFDALVAGTPLTWWEDHLQMTPAQIVGSKLHPHDELIRAWIQATEDQENEAWAEALFHRTGMPSLAGLVGADAAAAAFLAAAKDKTATRQLNTLLHSVPGPWTAHFSQQVLDWARKSDGGKGALGRMNTVQTVLADKLAPHVQPDLEKWLEAVRGDEDEQLQRILRNVIQQLSFRTSIDQAFS